MFRCEKCGQCCRNLDQSSLYKDLDNGNGICKYLDLNTNLCTIYETRPLKCRIDESFEKVFYKTMTLEDYYEANYYSCRMLQRQKKAKQKSK